MESTKNQNIIFGLTLMTIFITLIFSPKIKAAQAVSSTAPSQLTQLETEIIHLHSNILPGLNIGMEVLKYELPLSSLRSLEPLVTMIQPLLAMFEYRDSLNTSNNNSTSIQVVEAIINDSCQWIDVPGCSKEDIETLKQKYDLQLALREAYSGILYGYFLRKLCTRDTSLPTSFCEGERNSKVWLEEKNIHFPDTLNMT